MTAAAISNIPVAVGSAVFSALGRGLFWLILHVVRSPVSSALLVAMTLGIAMASTNALYLQIGQHPAPMFAEKPLTTSAVTPAQRTLKKAPLARQTSVPAVSKPASVPLVTSPVSVQAPVPAAPDAMARISNEEVKALQNKLILLKLYDGEADGFYGPKTADAIRAFEKSAGMTPLGALTPEVLLAVEKAKVPTAPRAEVKPVVPVVEVEPQAAQTGSSAGNSGEDAKLAAERAPEQKMPSGLTADPLVQIVQRVASAAQQGVSSQQASEKTELVEKIQRGLASLGFLGGKIDGVAGEATAKAIRNFEVYYNYDVTGAATSELVDLLAEAGAQL